jgi:hypothetical protein
MDSWHDHRQFFACLLLLWDADFGRWAFLTPPEHKKYGYTEFL